MRVKNMVEGISTELSLDGKSLMEYLDSQMMEAMAKRLQELEK